MRAYIKEIHWYTHKNNRAEIPTYILGFLLYLNSTISFGVNPMILHSFSTVISVTFLFFFKLSKVLLSIPDFNRKYCVIPLASMVFHSGS